MKLTQLEQIKFQEDFFEGILADLGNQVSDKMAHDLDPKYLNEFNYHDLMEPMWNLIDEHLHNLEHVRLELEEQERTLSD